MELVFILHLRRRNALFSSPWGHVVITLSMKILMESVKWRGKRLLITGCAGPLPAQVPVNNPLQTTAERWSHCNPNASTHTLFYSYTRLKEKLSSYTQCVTLIWTEEHLRGGLCLFTSRTGKFSNSAQSDVDPAGECVALAWGWTRSSTPGVKLIHPPGKKEKMSGKYYFCSSPAAPSSCR